MTPKKVCEVLTPRTCECDLIWKQGPCRGTQVKMRSSWLRVDPGPMTGILERRGRLGHTRRMPRGDRGRHWSDAFTGQGTPRMAGNAKISEEQGRLLL